MVTSRRVGALLLGWTCVVAGVAACAAPAPQGAPRERFALEGDWYVLVHWRDDRSKERDIVKFKDFVWSIEARGDSLHWYTYPFAIFDDEREALRREAMSGHRGWEPDAELLGQIRKQVRVGNRGAQSKTLVPGEDGGFRSPARRASGGMNTLQYSRDWTVTREGERIRISIVDTLSGAIAQEGISDTIEYVIEERVSPDEFRGTYREPHKVGPLRMIRTRVRAP